MIHQSVQALRSNDKSVAEKLYRMDDTVDALYRKYLREAISPPQLRPQCAKSGDDVSSPSISSPISDPRCYISALLIMRYLERISDHACYIADSVNYIVTGVSSPRR